MAITGTVVAAAGTVYSAKEQRKAQNKARDEARAQNELRKRQENIKAFRSNIAAERQRRRQLAAAKVVAEGSGQFGFGAGNVAGSTGFQGAVSAYNTQFGVNQGFTAQTNAFNQQILDSNSRIQGFQTDIANAQLIGQSARSIGGTISSFK